MDGKRIPLPRIIYDTIENVLEAQIHRLALDIAKTLGVSEKPLLQELKKEKITTYILDESCIEDIYELQCKAYVKNKHVYLPCDQPILYKKNFCLAHLEKHLLKEDINNNERLYVLYQDNIKYYCDIDNKVYDTDFNKIGIYNTSKKIITLFINNTS
jgi:hypothetical protein